MPSALKFEYPHGYLIVSEDSGDGKAVLARKMLGQFSNNPTAHSWPVSVTHMSAVLDEACRVGYLWFDNVSDFGRNQGVLSIFYSFLTSPVWIVRDRYSNRQRERINRTFVIISGIAFEPPEDLASRLCVLKLMARPGFSACVQSFLSSGEWIGRPMKNGGAA